MKSAMLRYGPAGKCRQALGYDLYSLPDTGNGPDPAAGKGKIIVGGEGKRASLLCEIL
jgi:hypothetical protein